MATLTKASEISAKPLAVDLTQRRSYCSLSGRNLTDVDVTLVLTAYGKCKNVDLSNNALRTLPDSFCMYLNTLVFLDLSDNEISKLPNNLGNLVNLQALLLRNNKLRLLPLSISRLEQLTYLDLTGNPLDEDLAKVSGDLSDCRQVAARACEFYFLLSHNIQKFPILKSVQPAAPPQGEEEQDALVERQMTCKPDALSQLSVTDIGESNGNISWVKEAEADLVPSELKLRKRSAQKMVHQITKTETEPQFQDFQALPQVAVSDRPFWKKFVAFVLVILGAIAINAICTHVDGPPLPAAGRLNYPLMVPEALFETLVRVHALTLYPFRGYFEGVDALTDAFVTTQNWF